MARQNPAIKKADKAMDLFVKARSAIGDAVAITAAEIKAHEEDIKAHEAEVVRIRDKAARKGLVKDRYKRAHAKLADFSL